MAIPDQSIEEAIKALREKQARVESGDPPVAPELQQPNIERPLAEQREAELRAKEAPLSITPKRDFGEDPPPPLNISKHSYEQEINRMSEDIDRLLNLLHRTAVHVAARNALGEKSKEFCCACNNARHESCILPELWRALE